MPQIVYILENDAMPGIVKVGKTTSSVVKRMKQLDNTTAPLPFRCFYAVVVDDAAFVEKQIHDAFGDQRVRSKREFFRISAHRIKAILDLRKIKEVTPKNEVETEKGDSAAMAKNQILSKRAARFKFSMVKLKPGTELRFVKNERIKAKVVDDDTIGVGGKSLSLSPATLWALKKTGINWNSVQGTQYWLFGDKTLQELREEFESN